ncbi:MAG: GTP-binding protein [Candidatus Kariarchaeaceae archaeon]
MIGDATSGKTSLSFRYVTGGHRQSHILTAGVNFLVKRMEIEHNNRKIPIKATIWDTGGQERFRTLIPAFYQGGKAALILSDVTRPSTLANTETWFQRLKEYAGDCPCLLVANKIDLVDERVVSDEEIAYQAKKLGIDYFCTSAITEVAVEETFLKLILEGYKYSQLLKIDEDKSEEEDI